MIARRFTHGYAKLVAAPGRDPPRVSRGVTSVGGLLGNDVGISSRGAGPSRLAAETPSMTEERAPGAPPRRPRGGLGGKTKAQ